VRLYRDRASNQSQTLNEDGGSIRQTPGYIEIEIPTDVPGSASVTYITLRSETSIWVCQNFGHTFTQLMKNFKESNTFVQDALTKELRDSKPLLYRLLENEVYSNYSEAALAVLEDPDDASYKWFVATVVGNIDLENESIFQPRTQAAIERVDNLSRLLAAEWRVPMNSSRLALRAAAATASSDIKTSARFIDRHFDSIVQLLGSA
jgi:hypothetical protein